MTEATSILQVPLVTLLLGLSLLLVAISAVRHYTRNFIIPGVTIPMFLGAIFASSPITEIVGFESDEIQASSHLMLLMG